MAGELERLLKEWARKRNLEPPHRDADGRHFFVFDGAFEVGLSQLGNSIFCEADLADLPERRDEAEALLKKLLKLQLAKARLGREVLSLAPEEDRLILFRVLRPDHLNYNRFEEAIGDFVNAAAFWMTKLEPKTQAPVEHAQMAEQIFYP